MKSKEPLPPFTKKTAMHKVRMAENAWNTRNPDAIVKTCTADNVWCNWSKHPITRKEFHALLTSKWEKEHEYRLIKELWAYTENVIAVRFAYEWQDNRGQYYRSYGNANWEFNKQGLSGHRFVSIDNLAIDKSERKFLWPLGIRPDNYPSLSDLGL